MFCLFLSSSNMRVQYLLFTSSFWGQNFLFLFLPLSIFTLKQQEQFFLLWAKNVCFHLSIFSFIFHFASFLKSILTCISVICIFQGNCYQIVSLCLVFIVPFSLFCLQYPPMAPRPKPLSLFVSIFILYWLWLYFLCLFTSCPSLPSPFASASQFHSSEGNQQIAWLYKK